MARCGKKIVEWKVWLLFFWESFFVLFWGRFDSEALGFFGCTKEAYLPEGPDGPEIDVSVPLTRQIFETAAAEVLKRLKEVLDRFGKLAWDTLKISGEFWLYHVDIC